MPQTYWHFTTCDPKVVGLGGPSVTKTPPLLHIGSFTTLDPIKAVETIVDTNIADLQYHSAECHGHPYASRWYTCPIIEHPVLFYYNSSTRAPDGTIGTASITDSGNPATWGLGIVALLFCVWRMLAGPRWLRISIAALGAVSLTAAIWFFHAAEQPATVTVHVTVDWRFELAFAGLGVFGIAAGVMAVLARRFVPAFIVMGYELAWLMWVPGNERRILFFYHALGMFIFMVLAVGYMLAALRRVRWRFAGQMLTLAPVAYGLIALTMASFIFFYPIWTGQPLSLADRAMRIWLDW